MLSHLDRKLWRDLSRMKGQALAVALVMACGLAMMVMARSLIYSLESTRREYYEANRFAEVFAQLKRAPNSIAARVAEIPGVATVQAGISSQVTLDIPGLDEPASGNVRSVPDFGLPELNRLFLRSGRWLAPGSRREVLVGEAFAEANHLQPGNTIAMLLNGRRQEFQIAGIVLSPEFVFESRPGAALPDNRTYGIFWMPYKELATALDLDGAFNSLSLTLAPGASEIRIIAALDVLLTPYGGRGAYGRADHPSHIRVSDEIRVQQILSVGFPLVFLSVAAFMTNAVLTRLLVLQREQIAILKAFGFTDRQIVMHYLKFAFVMVAGGTLLGGVGGVLLGRRLVLLYHQFFRFPDLSFRLDQTAFPLALLVSAAAATAGVFGAVRRAARLPPAEAMRPEPPANYRPALIERTGAARLLSHSFRIAVRNLERRPVQALFTVAGLALATGILIVPNCFRDGVAEIMDFQWDLVQRQDLSVGLVEPGGAQAAHDFARLPGVLNVEPMRHAFVRVSYGTQRRLLALQGLPRNGVHNRVVDESSHPIELPQNGLVISAKLAEALGARVGEDLIVEVLEGKRPVRTVRLTGLAEDFAGVAAYMDLHALNRLLEEGDVISGATFTIDAARRTEFLRALKGIPRVSWLAIKNSLRENFRQTTAASIGIIQTIYLVFATVVAFGVVYNNARISLAERARELATLRVIGFSRREVGAVLVTELVLLALLAVPLGLLLGTGFAAGILKEVNTETVRVPLVLTTSNYAFAVLVVTIASILSGLLVLRKLNQLDLVGALKAPE
ncbi:MAG TPA: FtsX-like permease family protein [Candidatus Binatia bacterium]|jgi:putative ABC transport system permease protein|nr:FtsX-like permease family protein [Candidatus Binatia bacterium]